MNKHHDKIYRQIQEPIRGPKREITIIYAANRKRKGGFNSTL